VYSNPGNIFIHDRDTKFCAAFQQLLDGVGVKRLPLPPRSPNLNAIAERWVRSVKSEALSPLILLGERSLRHVLSEYLTHYHQERCHQGLGNVIPFPARPAANDHEGAIHCHERLGGLLKFYDREAA
jgi:transposase InsO family protein